MQDTVKLLYACPECGCTDIETSAWIHVNTGTNTEGEGPSSYDFCPQCELHMGGGSFKGGWVQTEVAKPYDPEDVGEEA